MIEDDLPAEFLASERALEAKYLASTDPIRQSGFGGGAERWRAERSPILDAVKEDGALLDVGCANGYLLECLVAWGRERGRVIDPFGVDIGPRLIDRARARLPGYAEHFWVADAWTWTPPRRFRYVYALWDCVPFDHLAEFARRLLERAVEPGGRLILGAYGSRSRKTEALDIGAFLVQTGYSVAGTSMGGNPPLNRFAWVDRDSTDSEGLALSPAGPG